jgi:uncharacterized protein (DUF924 family)
MKPADVLDFWFGAPGSPEAGKPREFWFRKSSGTDALIRERFGALVESALRGELEAWDRSPRATLALIIVLDQFARNIHRDTPSAFAGDAAALALAQRLVERGDDLALPLVERWFAYMPFEHSEALQDQMEAVRLFEQLAEQGLPGPLPWARAHFDVIRRFGRFPHRNEILGRTSTPEEQEFLSQPGSRF